jgi:hypothetical protein
MERTWTDERGGATSDPSLGRAIDASSRSPVRGAGFDGHIDCIKYNTPEERVHHAAPPPSTATPRTPDPHSRKVRASAGTEQQHRIPAVAPTTRMQNGIDVLASVSDRLDLFARDLRS